MISLAIAFIVLASSASDTASRATPNTVAPSIGREQSSNVTRFAGRPEGRIAFARDVRNFEVKREGNDDVIFLETRRNTWYRSEIHCLGIGDPRDAHAIVSSGDMTGIDSFSRISLVSFSAGQSHCSLQSLVALTQEEAIEFRLIRQPKVPTVRPAS